MRVVTASEMAALDRAATEKHSIPSIILMENAARSCVAVLTRYFADRMKKQIVVFAGPGKNGGDGFAIAKCLKMLGVSVSVYSVKKICDLKGDTQTQANAYLSIKGKLTQCPCEEDWKEIAKCELQAGGLVIDAVLGTGSMGLPTGIASDAISVINSCGIPIVSIDIASGVNASNGAVLGAAVGADLTIAIQLPKLGNVLFPGASYAGEVIVVDAGIPIYDSDLNNDDIGSVITFQTISDKMGNAFTPNVKAHKGDRGHVLVVGGSAGHYGAAKLSAEAAMKCGVGLVTLALPKSASLIVSPELVEVMCEGLPDDGEGNFGVPNESDIFKLLENKTTLVIGPGLGQSEGSLAVLKQVLKVARDKKIKTVIDADGINLIARHNELFELVPEETCYTPHPGEASRILNCSTRDVQNDRLSSAYALAGKCRRAVVLKGARSIIVEKKNGGFAINLAATEVLATAGSGDVLSGIIGALLAKGLDPYTALVVGVFVHGRAGEILERQHGGPAGIVASDIAKSLLDVFKEVLTFQVSAPSLETVLIRKISGSRLANA